MNTVIVTRHAGAVAWLAQHGIDGDVITHVTDQAQIAGRVVVGALPLHLAVHAARVGSIDMPGLTADQRGQDLTPAEMDAAGASVQWYTVRPAGAGAAGAGAVAVDAGLWTRILDVLRDAPGEAYARCGAGTYNEWLDVYSQAVAQAVAPCQ